MRLRAQAKENKENKGETDNVDRFGHKITSIDDIVEVDYSDNYQGNDEVRNEVQRHHVRLFDEEDRLHQQLIIAKEAEKQDNRYD
mgnify:CR=1 FL=1